MDPDISNGDFPAKAGIQTDVRSGSRPSPGSRRSETWLYAGLALPLSFAGLPLYLTVPDHYATHYGVPLATIGVVMLLLRIIDAVQDPLLGRWAARLLHREAARRSLFLLGGGGMVLGLGLVFHPPAVTAPALWMAVGVFLAATGWSLTSVCYQSLGAASTPDPDRQTRLVAAREAMGLVGIIIASVAVGTLPATLGAERAYTVYVLLFAPLLGIALWMLFRWQKATVFQPEVLQPQERLHWQPVGQVAFWLAFTLSQLAAALPAVLFLFYVRDVLGAEALGGAFLAVYFISAAVGLSVWPGLARRLGHVRAWQAGMGLSVVTFAGASLLGAGDAVAFGVICILSGVALGADLALPAAILGNILKQDGGGRATVTFGWMGFAAKAALGLAAGIALPILGAGFGYQPGDGNAPKALTALAMGYAAIPCFLKILSLFALSQLKEIPDAKDPDPCHSGLADADRVRGH